MSPQNPHTGRMERADPDALRTKLHLLIHTLPHFSCCLIGKCNRHDIPWVHALILDQMGDPVSQDPGFTRARTRQNQKRPFCTEDGLFLLGIQQFIRTHICPHLF